jgi:hypothetical protein
MEKIYRSKVRKASGDGGLIFELLIDENDALFFRITDQDGGGTFSRDTIKIADCVFVDEERVRKNNIDKNSNNPAFQLAILKALFPRSDD